MAKIVEDTLVIKFSKIVKNLEQDPEPTLTVETIAALEQVAQELVGNNIIVEIDFK